MSNTSPHVQEWTTAAWSLQDRTAYRTIQHITLGLSSETMLGFGLGLNSTTKASSSEDDCLNPYINYQELNPVDVGRLTNWNGKKYQSTCRDGARVNLKHISMCSWTEWER